MKKLTILFVLIFTSSFFTACEDSGLEEGETIVSFDKTVYDFGTVNEGEMVETVFRLTNIGSSDLVITDAKASCGCTVPVWPGEAINPGESGDISARFNTEGKFDEQEKTVILTTNTEFGSERLTIIGYVTP